MESIGRQVRVLCPIIDRCKLDGPHFESCLVAYFGDHAFSGRLIDIGPSPWKRPSSGIGALPHEQDPAIFEYCTSYVDLRSCIAALFPEQPLNDLRVDTGSLSHDNRRQLLKALIALAVIDILRVSETCLCGSLNFPCPKKPPRLHVVLLARNASILSQDTVGAVLSEVRVITGGRDAVIPFSRITLNCGHAGSKRPLRFRATIADSCIAAKSLFDHLVG